MLKSAPRKFVRPLEPGRFVLGRERFARISAVAGVTLTAEMGEVMDRFEREGLSVVARRQAIRRRFALSGRASSFANGLATGANQDGSCDPYCYPGASVLKNRLGLRGQAELAAFEAFITAQRGEEPLPRGPLGSFHYRAIHHHLFCDVFAWAGKLRTARLAKGGSLFCAPEHINGALQKLFARLRTDRFLRNQSANEFARRSAEFLAALNAIHPFRDGNRRAQLAYFAFLAARAGHPLALQRMKPDAMLAAMVASFKSDEAPLAALIEGLIER